MKKYILILLTIFMAFLSYGQEDDIKFDNVKVIKEFNADIGNFNKVNIDPKLHSFDLSSRNYKYIVRAIPLKLSYEKPQIRPLALTTPEPKVINNYNIKLGYGIPGFFRGRLSLGMKRGNSNSALTLNHISANNTKNLKDQRNSETTLDLSYFNRKNEIDLEYGLNGSVGGNYYYLYANEINKDTMFTSAENKRRFLRGDFNAMVKKDNILSNIDSKLSFGYKFLQINTDKKLENSFSIDNKNRYKFSEYFSFNLPIAVNFITSDDAYILKTKPYFSYSSRLINVKLGGEIGKSQDLNFMQPYGKISSNLFSNFLEVFVSVDNEIYNNSNYLKTLDNPFINFNEDSISTSFFNNYSGGLRSSFEGIKIEFIGNYQKFKNKLFYNTSNTDKRTFSSIYDDGTNFQLEANISYKILPQLEISGNLLKNFYKLDNLEKAWHTPDFTANFTAKTFLLSKKLSVTGELFFASQSWFKDIEGNKKKSDPLFDISGEARYKFLKNSYFFIEVNNIFAQKYQRWYQYPTYGINLLAGIEIGF